MARPRGRNFDPQRVMQELLDTLVSIYGASQPHPSLSVIADELGLNPIKVRKLLITAGVYESEIADKVNEYHGERKSVEEMVLLTGLSRASVHSYLPYSKMVYKADEISMTAQRIRKYRKRDYAVKMLCENMTVENLWNALITFEDYPFYTAKGLKFTYCIKGGELFVSRKEKSITEATVELAFEKAIELEGKISGPKKLGVFGASYLYPMFARFGIIQIEENEFINT